MAWSDEEPLKSEQVAELEAAVKLYTGDLLEGLYTDWCLLERERFRLLYPDGLPISAGEHRTEVEYRIHSAELSGERCRFLVQDAIENTLACLKALKLPIPKEVGSERIEVAR